MTSVSSEAVIRIGTSGWSYDHWEGAFYPPEVRPAERLAWYARRFPTVEINATFYRLPSEKTVGTWRDAVPSDFTFSVKGSRFITHYRRLEGVGESVESFCARVGLLGERLHVVLWQLPPDMTLDAERLGEFLRLLPRDVRHAVEFRDPSWLVESVFHMLREHGVAQVQVSSDIMPVDLTTTADFAYVRFHGLAGYHGAYVSRELEPWADFVRSRRDSGCDAYVYFNNDANAHAPRDAATLQRLSRGEPAR